MFGYVQADTERLTLAEKDRYKAVYCRLCHALGQRHGFSARMGLTYDMTFLALLLSSLYEPTETENQSRCVVHPLKKHCYVNNECINYAADMTVALVYFKCIDDWNDEKKVIAKGYSALLSNAYKKA